MSIHFVRNFIHYSPKKKFDQPPLAGQDHIRNQPQHLSSLHPTFCLLVKTSKLIYQLITSFALLRKALHLLNTYTIISFACPNLPRNLSHHIKNLSTVYGLSGEHYNFLGIWALTHLHTLSGGTTGSPPTALEKTTKTVVESQLT